MHDRVTFRAKPLGRAFDRLHLIAQAGWRPWQERLEDFEFFYRVHAPRK